MLMSDTDLIALCNFSAIFWSGVGKDFSGIGTLGGVSGWLSSGITGNMGGGVDTLSFGVGWYWGTLRACVGDGV